MATTRRSAGRTGGGAVLVVAILVAGACGAAPSAHGRTTLGATNGAPTSLGAPSTTVPAADRTLTASAAGSTVALSVGEALVVSLSSAGQVWTPPRSSDPAVLRSRSVSADGRTGAASATFVAGRPGSARLRSTRRCLPHPGRACAQYIALWSVTVTVR